MKFIDLVKISFRNLFRRKMRTILTIISMMVGAFLISVMISVGNGLEVFLVSQVTMFSNKQTISVQKKSSVDAGTFFGGGVERYKEESEIEDNLDQSSQTDDDGSGNDSDNDTDSSSTQSSRGAAFGMRLNRDDLEKIKELDYVEVAEFSTFMIPEYIDILDNDLLIKVRNHEKIEGEEKETRLKVTLIGLPMSLKKDIGMALHDEELFEKDNSIILSDGYVEAWGLNREDLIGKKIRIRVENIFASSPTRNPLMGDSAIPAPGENGSFGNNEEGTSANGSAEGNTFMPDGIELDTNESQQNGFGNLGDNGFVEGEKDFEFIVAGIMEKSLVSQMGIISNERLTQLNAFRFGKSEEDFSEEEDAFEIIVLADKEENIEKLDKLIEEAGYRSTTYDESIGQIGAVFNVINLILSSFGIIALVVASIGIINTLLMAIYERTREIGVMKAVGATRAQIAAMFTMEATLLGFWGGLFGLLLGWGIGSLANYLLHNGLVVAELVLVEAYLADYPTYNVSVFSADVIVLVMLVTTGVAFFAGIYPAARASKLDPIKALRTD